MFPSAMIVQASGLLEQARSRGLRLAAAESCSGGLIAALLTEVSGSSDIFDCGFVTYSNAAKTEMLGVDAALIGQFGAVSEEVARAMAAGAIARSRADFGVSVTGIAGPGGGTPDKPVGLVWLACHGRDGPVDANATGLAISGGRMCAWPPSTGPSGCYRALSAYRTSARRSKESTMRRTASLNRGPTIFWKSWLLNSKST